MAGNNIDTKIVIGGEQSGADAAINRTITNLERLRADAARGTERIALFERATADLEAMQTSLEEARRKLAYFREQARLGGDTGVKAFAADIKAAEREIDRLNSGITKQRAALNGMADGLGKAGINTRELAAEKSRLQSAMATAERGVINLKGRLGEESVAAKQAAVTTKEAGQAAQQAGNQAEQGSAGMMDMATAMKALAGAAVVREFVQVNASMESLEKSMALVTGSSEAAQREMAFVREEAQRLGLEVGAAANSYLQLAASAKGTALEGAATREIWSSVAQAMAQLGKTTAETDGALLAISQMMSKGTVSAEELRGQLGERLPGAFQVAAKAMGVTTAELGKLLESGQIAANDFLPKFAAELRKTGGGEIDTFNANLNRLKNTFSDVLSTIGDTGAWSAVNEFIKGASVAVITLWEGFELLGKTIGNIGYTIASLDFAGYRERQKENLANAQADVSAYIEKVYSIGKAAKDVEATATEATTGMADGFKVIELSAKEVEQRLRELEKTLSPIEQAYQDLGLVSSAALQETANAARKAYETLVAAKAPAEDLRLAWLEYAKAAMDAAQRAGDGQANVTRATLEAEAAAKGYIVTISQDGEVVSQTLAEWAEGYDKLAEAQDRARAAAQESAAAIARTSAEINDFNRGGIGSLQGSIDDFYQHMRGLGDAMAGVINSTRDAVRQATNDSEAALKELQHAIDGVGLENIDSYLRRLWDSQKRIVEQYKAQSEAAERFIERLKEGNAQLDKAIMHTDMLDEQTLDNLRAAIEDAKRRMADFADQARDAVSGLRSELAGLRGDYEAVARIEGEQKLSDLELQLDEARRTGNTEAIKELREAIRLQKEINRLRLEEAKNRANENKPTTRAGDKTDGYDPSSNYRGPLNVNLNVNGFTDPRRMVDELAPLLERKLNLSR